MKKLLSSKISKLNKTTLFLIVLSEFILVALLLTIVMRSAVLNRNDKIKYADETRRDEISCTDGKLKVNDVTAAVPATDSASYSISYSWSKDDKDYPTIPRAALVSYSDDSDHLLYEISLYRDSFTPKKDIPKGKNASNWFDDWKLSKGDDPSIKQAPIKAGKISGFLVSTADDEKAAAYSVSSYYFVTEDKDGVSVYILEGTLYRDGDKKEFKKVMNDSFSSLQIKQRAAEPPAGDSGESEDSEDTGA